MHDEIAGVHACGEHVFEEQRIMSVKGDQRITALLLLPPGLRLLYVAELTDVERVNSRFEIGDRVRHTWARRCRRE